MNFHSLGIESYTQAAQDWELRTDVVVYILEQKQNVSLV